MFKTLFASLFIISASAGASAPSDWEPVTEDTDGWVWSLNVSNVRRSGDTVRYWSQIDASADRKVKWRSSKRLVRVHCGNWTQRLLFSAKYGPNSELVDQDSVTDYVSETGMEPIVPDTTGEKLAQVVCGRD